MTPWVRHAKYQAAGRGMTLTHVRLLEKHGGKSGDWVAGSAVECFAPAPASVLTGLPRDAVRRMGAPGLPGECPGSRDGPRA